MSPAQTTVEPANPVLVPGLAAGLVGGAIMAAFMLASGSFEGVGAIEPLRPLGHAFLGPEARGRGAASLLYGLALHLAFSAAIGVVITTLVPRDSAPAAAAVVAVGYAMAVMAVMTALVLPDVNPSLREAMPEHGGAWVIAHALYGATVGWVAQHLQRRPRAEREAVARSPGAVRG